MSGETRTGRSLGLYAGLFSISGRLLWHSIFLLVVLCSAAILTPIVIRACEGAEIATLAMGTMAILFPLGLVLGMQFPCGIRLASSRYSALIPWFWGINGESAGGHLALLLGMIPESEGLDRQCASKTALPRVAAVINWFGITDVGDVVYGENRVDSATQWIGSAPNREEIARRISPLTWVRHGIPPVLTIHSERDPVVPYRHSVRLHEELAKAEVPNRLLTIPGRSHGPFTRDERTRIFVAIREFLAKSGVIEE